MEHWILPASALLVIPKHCWSFRHLQAEFELCRKGDHRLIGPLQRLKIQLFTPCGNPFANGLLEQIAGKTPRNFVVFSATLAALQWTQLSLKYLHSMKSEAARSCRGRRGRFWRRRTTATFLSRDRCTEHRGPAFRPPKKNEKLITTFLYGRLSCGCNSVRGEGHEIIL